MGSIPSVCPGYKSPKNNSPGSPCEKSLGRALRRGGLSGMSVFAGRKCCGFSLIHSVQTPLHLCQNGGPREVWLSSSNQPNKKGTNKRGNIWPWVNIQIVPPVNIRLNPTTKIGSEMGGEFTYNKMGPLVLTHSQVIQCCLILKGRQGGEELAQRALLRIPGRDRARSCISAARFSVIPLAKFPKVRMSHRCPSLEVS